MTTTGEDSTPVIPVFGLVASVAVVGTGSADVADCGVTVRLEATPPIDPEPAEVGVTVKVPTELPEAITTGLGVDPEMLKPVEDGAKLTPPPPAG